jgi:hypothetical protein
MVRCFPCLLRFKKEKDSITLTPVRRQAGAEALAWEDALRDDKKPVELYGFVKRLFIVSYATESWVPARRVSCKGCDFMEIDVYKAKGLTQRGEYTFALVPAGTAVDAFPPGVRKRLGELTYEKRLTIEKGEERIGIDTDTVIDDIERQGYHLRTISISHKPLDSLKDLCSNGDG